MVRVRKSKRMPGHLEGQKELYFTDAEMSVADANVKPDRRKRKH